jgi:aryl-alcohol dehydrogenase-like predicted oxidoreductase
VIPLFSTGNVDHLDEILGASRLRLEEEDVALLRDPLAPVD